MLAYGLISSLIGYLYIVMVLWMLKKNKLGLSDSDKKVNKVRCGLAAVALSLILCKK
jgi:hypothetical protein